MSKPLTLAELKLGDHFIGFPQDGDDEGHGGYRAGSWVWNKLKDGNDHNVVRVHDGVISSWPETMEVYKVLL